MRRALVVLALGALVLGGCSHGDQRVTGTVMSVDGDLTTVRSFQVLTDRGERLDFVPGPDLHAFPDGTPLTHLSEHFQTGVPVRVTYRVENGENVAITVEDAG